jgi:hypothetical protein
MITANNATNEKVRERTRELTDAQLEEVIGGNSVSNALKAIGEAMAGAIKGAAGLNIDSQSSGAGAGKIAF